MPLVESHYLSTLGEIIGQGLEKSSRVDWVREQVLIKLPILSKLDQPIIDEISDLYEKILDLHSTKRNGMWWQMSD